MTSAIEQFGTVGYLRTTAAEICRGANVSTRNFYEYYADKEDLLIAVHDEIAGKANADALAGFVAAAEGDIESMARGALTGYLAAMLDDERHARIVYIEVVGVTPRVERRRREIIHGFVDLAESVIDAQIQAGRIAPRPRRDLRIAATAMIGGVHEVVTDWLASDREVSRAELLDALVEYFLILAAGAA